MYLLRAVSALGPIDAKSTLRDPLLRWLVLYPVFLSVLLRWGAPWLREGLLQRFALDLAPYYWLIMSFMVPTTPFVVGIVIGFLLLDQRDDRTLTALQVTPLTLGGYLTYRLAVPIVLGVAVTVAVFAIADLVDVPLGWLLLAALGAAPLAAIVPLFLAAFAANKVQGFALSKALGAVLVPPVVAYFIDPPWQLAAGVVPVYWPVKFFWTVAPGSEPGLVYLVVGLGYQVAIGAWLLRRFERVMTR